uniref:MSP domain-containing protein n=1 Tax=Caenorhabditis japonica TaxID=281687 RepID=A0A8R1ILW1_CAEJA
MAQSVPPGDIATHPNAKIVINSSARRIGYGIKTTNMKRLGVDPPRGVLDPKEAVSPSSEPTLRMEPPSSSVASGSSETVWCAEREPSNRVQSITRHRDPDKLPKQ